MKKILSVLLALAALLALATSAALAAEIDPAYLWL